MENYCPFCMTSIPSGGPCPCCGKDPGSYQPSNHHFPPGRFLHNRYLVGRTLGEGGFGITYLGLDTVLGRRVAVKEYFPNVFVRREASISLEVTCYTDANQDIYEKGREQFLQEARVMARFDKVQEVVQVLDFFPANNTAYIVMEYLEGITLRALLKQKGRIPATELLEMMEPVLRALEAVHGAGIIHRDISTDNMVLEEGRIKLLDFGCARGVDGDRTMTIMLKHGYAPMEQYTGHNQGPWTDIYALSATLYCCLTGKVPPQALDRFGADPDPLVPPNSLGAGLTQEQERALLRGLAVDARKRWQSMAGLYEGLYHGAADVPDEEGAGRTEILDYKPVSEPEPQSEPAPQLKRTEVLDFGSAPEPESEPESSPQPKRTEILAHEPAPEPEYKPEPEPQPESEHQPEPEPQPAPRPAPQPRFRWEQEPGYAEPSQGVHKPVPRKRKYPRLFVPGICAGVIAVLLIVMNRNNTAGKNDSYPDELPNRLELSIENLPCTLSASWYHVVGLKPDGTVVRSVHDGNEKYDLDDWTDIVSVVSGVTHFVGLKSDGTVVAVADPQYNDERVDVGNWTDIVAVESCGGSVMGLKSDGTVVVAGNVRIDTDYGKYDVGGWTDIVSVAAATNHTAGLKSDGTVVAVGSNSFGRCDVDGWTDIVAIDASFGFTMGLKSDGTVVSTGASARHEGTERWSDIVAISADDTHTVGLKSDGTVMVAGRNGNYHDYGQYDVGSWKDIVAVVAGNNFTLGLKSDGTVVGAGEGMEYIDVSDWVLQLPAPAPSASTPTDPNPVPSESDLIPE